MAININPNSGIRVPSVVMRRFVSNLFEKAGTKEDHAALISAFLVDSDLRGIYSHGTRMTPLYVNMMLEGRVNPRPNVRFVSERDAVCVVDGDGGLGHLACRTATEWAITTARRNGVAAATTRNHSHFGAAGTFARLALKHDCVGMALSARRIVLSPGKSIRFSHSGGPIAIAVPTHEQPPLVMDKGIGSPWHKRIFERYPSIYLKDLALGAVLQAMGGILAGIYQREFSAKDRTWESDQGAFVAVFNIESFMPVDEFKTEMDRYIADARKMTAFPGFGKAELPGGPEWERYSENQNMGIPIGIEHEHILRHLASELSVDSPFADFEHTRFGSNVRDVRPALTDAGKRVARAARKRLFGPG